MGKRRIPAERVVIRGVSYVVEDKTVATKRRLDEKRPIVRKTLRPQTVKVGALVLQALERPREPTPPTDPSKPKLKHMYIVLPGATNEFTLEGCLTLPPKKVETKYGSRELCNFMVGYRTWAKGDGNRSTPGHGMPTTVYLMACDELARTVLTKYKQGDHVIVRGGFATNFIAGRTIVNHVVQSIEMICPAADIPSTTADNVLALVNEIVSGAPAG